MASITSHGTYWTVIIDGETSYVIKESASWKEIISIKRKIKLQDRAILRVSPTGLICFSCPEDQNCTHRTLLEDHVQSVYHSDFTETHSDIPGLKFKDTIELQPQQLAIKKPNRVGTNAVTLVCTADRVKSDHTIRLLLSPVSGGPYSIFGAEVPGSNALSQSVTGRVEGLAPGSAYYYVAQIIDEDGHIVDESYEQGFVTQSHNPTTSRIKDLRLNSATITGTVDFVSPDQVILLAWGAVDSESINIASRVTGNSSPGQLISADLKGLTPGTEYWYSVQVTDHTTSALVDESMDRLFITLDYSVSSHVPYVLGGLAEVEATLDYVRTDQEIKLVYWDTKANTIDAQTFKGTDQKGQKVRFLLTGLKEGTKYSYNVQILEKNKVLYSAPTKDFKTKSYNLTQHPTHDVRAGTAILSGTGDWVGKNESLLIVVDGDVIAEEQGTETAGQKIKARLIDLKPITKHECKLAVLRDGEIVSESVTTFETKTQNPTAIGAVNIKDRTATLMGYADFVPLQQFIRFAWGERPGEYTATSTNLFGNDTENQTFAYMAFSLKPETTYYYVIQVVGSDGVTVMDQSEEMEFTTAVQIRLRKRK